MTSSALWFVLVGQAVFWACFLLDCI